MVNIESIRRWLRKPSSVISIIGGVAIPLIGYFWLVLVAWPIGWKLPPWVVAAIPASAVGPAHPSLGFFSVLAVTNIAIWFSLLLILFWVLRKVRHA